MKKYKMLLLIMVLIIFIFPIYVNAEEAITTNSSKVEISVVDVEKNLLISNVEFEIQDEEGNILYAATSKEKEYVIDELEEGIYYYVEKIVPEGYELRTDKIKFSVDAEDMLVNIRIAHELVENTSELITMETAILVGVAMFDIAIGIGIIIYVKKNKDKK